jgi:hypothetical protein
MKISVIEELGSGSCLLHYKKTHKMLHYTSFSVTQAYTTPIRPRVTTNWMRMKWIQSGFGLYKQARNFGWHLCLGFHDYSGEYYGENSQCGFHNIHKSQHDISIQLKQLGHLKKNCHSQTAFCLYLCSTLIELNNLPKQVQASK